MTQIVTTSLGLLPEIVHLAVQRGPDLVIHSGQGQPSYMRQFTGSGLHVEFNPKTLTYFDDICLHAFCAWAEDTQEVLPGKKFP